MQLESNLLKGGLPPSPQIQPRFHHQNSKPNLKMPFPQTREKSALGVRSQTEKHLSCLGEPLGGKFFIGVLSEVASNEGIDGLAVLTGVDFNTLASALEEINRGQCLGLEGVESELDAFHIVVTSARVFGAAQDTFFENSVGALKVQHLREFSFSAEDFVPAFQVGEGSREAIKKEVLLAGQSGNVLHRVLEQIYNDLVRRQLSGSNTLFDCGGGRPFRLAIGAEQISSG
jgi:hypothetical protein